MAQPLPQDLRSLFRRTPPSAGLRSVDDAREDQQHCDGDAGLPPEFGGTLEEERPEAQKDGGGAQESPVEIFVTVRFLPLHHRAAPDAGDDLEGDIAIRLVAQLKVFAAAGTRNLTERIAIERGIDGRKRYAIDVTARRAGDGTARRGADADDVHREVALIRVD